MRGYWLSEGGTITSSKPTLREVTLRLAKLGVVVYLTQELIDVCCKAGTSLDNMRHHLARAGLKIVRIRV
mgnify:CR=1 FL=1